MNIHPIPSRFAIALLASLLLLTGCQRTAIATPTIAPTPIRQPDGLPLVPEATGNPDAISADILLDPALAMDPDSRKVCRYLYEGLVRLDAGAKVQPALAESWIVSDDRLDYIFTIRSTAVFSDGTPVTPDVVADNFDRWFDPASTLRAGGEYLSWKEVFVGFRGEKGADGRPLSPVDGIQKVDAGTVLIHLNRPVPDLLVVLAGPAFAILSPAALLESGYGSYPGPVVSSGPYVVSSWTETILLLTPNLAYWADVPPGDLQFSLR